MADIQLEALRDQKKREFKTQGAGNDRFEADFLDAVNRSINRINIGADLATSISRVESVDDPVTLDVRYEHVLSDLITAEMIPMGQRLTQRDASAKSREDLALEINSIRRDILQDIQDADEDDESAHSVGLGHLA